MAKDYYLILGVPVDAAPDQIRSAFRRLALRYHPDRRRESSPAAFQDISEAYDVLSDPARRARYDDETHRRKQPFTRAAEPLTSEPLPVTGRPDSVRPSYEGLLDRLMKNFLDAGAPKAERAEPLNFELILSPAEARRGIRIPFEVPVFSVCLDCGGSGRDWVFPCDRCGGEGRVVDREIVDARVPAGVQDGTMIDVSLEELGIRNLWLRVHVRIAAH